MSVKKFTLELQKLLLLQILLMFSISFSAMGNYTLRGEVHTHLRELSGIKIVLGRGVPEGGLLVIEPIECREENMLEERAEIPIAPNTIVHIPTAPYDIRRQWVLTDSPYQLCFNLKILGPDRHELYTIEDIRHNFCFERSTDCFCAKFPEKNDVYDFTTHKIYNLNEPVIGPDMVDTFSGTPDDSMVLLPQRMHPREPQLAVYRLIVRSEHHAEKEVKAKEASPHIADKDPEGKSSPVVSAALETGEVLRCVDLDTEHSGLTIVLDPTLTKGALLQVLPHTSGDSFSMYAPESFETSIEPGTVIYVPTGTGRFKPGVTEQPSMFLQTEERTTSYIYPEFDTKTLSEDKFVQTITDGNKLGRTTLKFTEFGDMIQDPPFVLLPQRMDKNEPEFTVYRLVDTKAFMPSSKDE
jgi:hypothetical protein